MAQGSFTPARAGDRLADNRRDAIAHSKKCETLIPLHEPLEKADVFMRKELRPDGFNEDRTPRSIEVSIFHSKNYGTEYYLVKGSEGDRPMCVTLPKSIMKPLSSGPGAKGNPSRKTL